MFRDEMNILQPEQPEHQTLGPQLYSLLGLPSLLFAHVNLYSVKSQTGS